MPDRPLFLKMFRLDSGRPVFYLDHLKMTIWPAQPVVLGPGSVYSSLVWPKPNTDPHPSQTSPPSSPLHADQSPVHRRRRRRRTLFPRPRRSIPRANISARTPRGAPPARLDSRRGRLLRALSHPSPL